MKTSIPKHATSLTQKLRVKPSEIDSLRHVNNVVYLKWANAVAEKHWSILTNKELESKFYWVALRHEIDYLKPAFLNDEIRIETWIGESKGVRSVRYVHIYKEDNLLVKTKTVWCLIDAVTHKPTRITQEILGVLIQIPN